VERTGDEGFSLAETLVALGIAVVALLSLLGASIFALRSSVEGRQNQLAGDLLNGAFEEARSLSYSALALSTADVTATTDAGIDKTVTPPLFDPGEGPAEPISMQATGASTHLTPYIQQKSTASGPYTVKRYVTVPAGTPTVRGLPAVKRLTVVVTWKNYSKTHVRRAGTLITNTRRGLPLPSYTWTYNGPAPRVGEVPTWTKNPSTSVDYGFVLVNKGARDSWALTTTPAVPGWTWYRDANQNGLYDTGEVALGTSSFATGLIEAGAGPFHVVAHRDIAASEVGTTTTSFTAGSVSQPAYPVKFVNGTLTVFTGAAPTATPTPSATTTPTPTPSPTPAPACTPGTSTGLATSGTMPVGTANGGYDFTTPLRLYNGAPDGNTTTLASNTLGTSTSLLQSSVCNFSTDTQTNEGGRLLTSSGSGTAGVAEWRFQPASDVQDQFRGTAVLSLWVQCPSGAPTLTARLGTYSTSTTTFVEQGSGTAAASGCPAASSQFHRVDISIAISDSSGFNVASGTTQRLAVRLTSNQQVRLLYGTTSTPAQLSIGMK